MLKPPPSLDPVALADWVELEVLFGPEASVSKAEFSRALEALHVDDAKLDVNRLVGDINRQIRIRQIAARTGYPLESTRLSYAARGSWTDYLTYSFMLLCSSGLHYGEMKLKSGQTNVPAEAFGFIAVEAVAGYLGGDAFRFDSPRREPVPSGFQEGLDHLERMTLEPRGARDITTGSEKDDGVDIFGWKSFRDARAGQVIILGQCAIGADWKSKFGDIKEVLWAKHMAWHVPPVHAFLVPFLLEGPGKDWERACASGGVFFDRLRVAAFGHGRTIPAAARTKTLRWCRRRIEVLTTAPELAG